MSSIRFTSSELPRFLLAGFLNTLGSYGLYRLFLAVSFPYPVAYTLSFIGGIGLSYGLNRYFVFRQSAQSSLSHLWLYPLVYLFQYGLGLVLLTVFVKLLSLPATWAPLLALPITIPITFLLSRRLLRKAS